MHITYSLRSPSLSALLQPRLEPRKEEIPPSSKDGGGEWPLNRIWCISSHKVSAKGCKPSKYRVLNEFIPSIGIISESSWDVLHPSFEKNTINLGKAFTWRSQKYIIPKFFIVLFWYITKMNTFFNSLFFTHISWYLFRFLQTEMEICLKVE